MLCLANKVFRINRLAPFLILLAVCIGCGRSIPDTWVRSSPADRVGIVFYFKKEVTNDQINHFLDYELGRPTPDGRGSDLPEEVKGDFLVRAQGFEGYALELSPNITKEQHEKIMTTLKQSPLIFKVFENAIPDEIILDPIAAKKEKEDSEKSARDGRPTKRVIVNGK